MNKKFIHCLGLSFLVIQNAFAIDIKQLQKSWSGKFDDQKIGVFIQSIDRIQVQGYSVLGKNKQNFSGKVQATSHGYKITAVESGSKSSSGVFTFTISHSLPNVLDASWESATDNVKPKYFDLKPQQCLYQKDVGGLSCIFTAFIERCKLTNATRIFIG